MGSYERGRWQEDFGFCGKFYLDLHACATTVSACQLDWVHWLATLFLPLNLTPLPILSFLPTCPLFECVFLHSASLIKWDEIVSCGIQPCSCPYIAATPPILLLTPLPVLLASRPISKPTCRRIQIGLVAFFWLFSTVYFPTCESRRNQCDSCQCRWHLILLIKSDIIWWQNLMTVDHTSYETDDSWSQLKVTEPDYSWSLITID